MRLAPAPRHHALHQPFVAQALSDFWSPVDSIGVPKPDLPVRILDFFVCAARSGCATVHSARIRCASIGRAGSGCATEREGCTETGVEVAVPECLLERRERGLAGAVARCDVG